MNAGALIGGKRWRVRGLLPRPRSSAFKRTMAWAQLNHKQFIVKVSSMYGEAPLQLRGLLRMDLFGNLISKEVRGTCVGHWYGGQMWLG
jgi:hypothetical protein